MMISTRAASFLVVALLGCLGFHQVDGQCESFGLAKYFGSKMVLQKSPQTAKIWGYSGAAGDQVTVSLVGVQDVVAVAESRPDGTFVWEAILDPVDDDTGSYTINIVSGSCSIQLTDILFGDVWVCSGQSNMQFQMSELDNPSPDLDDVVNYPQVRTFFTELTWSDTPQTDLLGVRRTWDLPTRNNISPFSALCWLYGRNLFRKLNRPIGLIESNWGGTRIEAWSSPDALSQCFANVDPGNPPNGASQLWNAMILPFTTIPIKGAIWYQGESNSGNAFIYGCALKAMVTDWRQKWFSGLPGGARNDFPFGQVQLAPWRNQDIQSGFPDVRWQQTDSLGYTPNSNMPGIFTAVAIDLPDYSSPSGDIHPRYKRQIADRLSLAAFQVAYGQTDVGLYQGPIPSSFSNDGTTVRVFYSTTLQYNNGNYFELCCGSSPTTTCSIGGQWSLATVSESNPNNLLLNIPCSGGNFVTGFRYNWRESPCDLESCAIYSVENNLPAPPFLYNGEILAGKMVKV